MEFLQAHSGLPTGQDSLVKFTLQSKHEMYTRWEQTLFRVAGDQMRFSYPTNHWQRLSKNGRSNSSTNTRATASI